MLDVVEEITLLGVTIRSDLSWSKDCQEMWMLQRLKPLEANTSELLEIYQTQIRSVVCALIVYCNIMSHFHEIYADIIITIIIYHHT